MQTLSVLLIPVFDVNLQTPEDAAPAKKGDTKEVKSVPSPDVKVQTKETPGATVGTKDQVNMLSL